MIKLYLQQYILYENVLYSKVLYSCHKKNKLNDQTRTKTWMNRNMNIFDQQNQIPEIIRSNKFKGFSFRLSFNSIFLILILLLEQ